MLREKLQNNRAQFSMVKETMQLYVKNNTNLYFVKHKDLKEYTPK